MNNKTNNSDHENSKEISFKNIEYLKLFLNEDASISPKKSSISASMHRKINRAIKTARFLALLPYCSKHIKVE